MTASEEQSRTATAPALDRQLLGGLAWTGAAKWGSQLLSWAATILVARLLAPSDYGIVGIATLYLGLVQMVSEFGLGTAIVQDRRLPPSAIARLGGLSIAIGLALVALSVILAPSIAGYFDVDASARVIAVMSVSFLVTALQVVPMNLLARDLEFRALAAVDTSEAVSQAVVTLALAWAGASYWSLAIGGIAGKSIATIVAWRLRPYRLEVPRRLRELAGTLTFGWRVVVSRVSWYVYSNADFAVIGKLLGSAALGAYTFGWTLASLPVDKITAVVSRVAMPVLSSVQHDARALSRYLLLLSEGLVLVTLPAGLGLALVAPDLIAVALGPKWEGAVVPLQLLAVHVPFRCLLSPFSQALLAMGETKQSVRVGLVQVIVMPAAFVAAGAKWGVAGVAAAWLTAHPIITVPMLLLFTLRRVQLRLRELVAVLAPSIVSALVMAGAVALVNRALVDSSAAVRLPCAVFAGVFTYAAALFVLYRGRLKTLVERLRELRSSAAA